MQISEPTFDMLKLFGNPSTGRWILSRGILLKFFDKFVEIIESLKSFLGFRQD